MAEGTLITAAVLHGKLELAVAVRQALEGVRPDAIAVELPETLEKPVLRAAARLPLLSVVSYAASDGRPVYLVIEPADPVIEAVRYGLEHDIPVRLVDRDTERYGRHAERWPDAYAVRRLGHARYVEACAQVLGKLPPDPADAAREEVMAYHLARMLREHERVLFVCGLAHAARVEARVRAGVTGEPLRRVRRDEVLLYHLSAPSSREVLAEPAFLGAAFERARREGAAAMDGLDRIEAQLDLCRRARANHLEHTGDEVSASALEVMFRFARNYALVEQKLCADLFQLLVAARGAVDDNFAFEVFDLAVTWPWQTDTPELPVIDLSLDDLFESTMKIRFHRTEQRRRRGMLRLVRERKKEGRPGEWEEGWKGEAICSHQPEDLVVESYGEFLKRKAKGMLSAENARVEPFSSSLLDGVDVRETLRNWHEGRLYVREHRVVKGDVGSVVIIFDEDDGKVERYPFTMTWQGEHEQESDMALYATPAGEHLVGPGISRCEYGGLLLSFPPRRMFGVFQDPYYDNLAETKPERLLLAGIDYSEHRVVVYVGPKPPRSRFRSIAERFGRKVVYIPLGDLSPVSVRQVRHFHVLDGHPVRAWAREYIR